MIIAPSRKLWTPPRRLWVPPRCPRCRKPRYHPGRHLRKYHPTKAASGDILLDTSGNIMLDSVGNIMLDDGSGSACCCGCTCISTWTPDTDIHGNPCPNCTLCPATVGTPAPTVAVTFSGVTVCSGCILGADGNYWLSTGTLSLGTYTLYQKYTDQCSDIVDCSECHYEFGDIDIFCVEGHGPQMGFQTGYCSDNSICTGPCTGANSGGGVMAVALDRISSTTWRVVVTGFPFAIDIFRGTATTTDCCKNFTVSNTYTACGPPTNMGYGGVAIVTVC